MTEPGASPSGDLPEPEPVRVTAGQVAPLIAVSMPFASVGHATVDREGDGDGQEAEHDWAGGAPAVPVRYRKVSLLGQGGMGSVWLGHDVLLDRAVAIKVPGADDHRTRMLANEARLAARLDHPGVVAVYDVAKLDGWPCFVMAHVRGRSVRALLLSGEVMRVPRAVRVRWIIEAADAVDSAHQQGLVHHDLSPGNVLVDEQGRVRVIDWGLAVDLRREQPLTGGGGGTPGYTAPEVLAREVATPAADVWSLGAILCDLLAVGDLSDSGPQHDSGPHLATTAPLADGPLPSALVATASTGTTAAAAPMTPEQRLDQVERLDVDDRWKSLLRRCLAATPGDRPATAGGLRDALEDLNRSVLPGPAAGRGRRALTLAGMVLLAMVVATVALRDSPHSGPSSGMGELGTAASPSGVDGAMLMRAAATALAAGEHDAAVASIGDALEARAGAEARRMAWGLLRLPALEIATGGAADGCPNATFHPDGATVACWTASRIELRRGGEVSWSMERSVRDVRLEGDAVVVLDESRAATVLDLDDGDLVHHDPLPGEFSGVGGTTRIRMDRGAILAAPGSGQGPLPVPCEEGAFAVSGGDAPWLVACVEGGVWRMSAHDEPRLLGGSEGTVFTTVAWVDTRDGRRPVGGTRAGDVIVIEGSGVDHGIGEPVERLIPTRWPGVVIAHGMRGRLQALDIAHGGVRAWLPDRRGRVTVLADGRLVVADHAGRWLRWPAEVPLPPLPRHRLQTPHGFTSVAWDAEGDHLVALDGVGRVVAFRPRDGEVLPAARWGEGVGKSIELSPVDGRLRMTGIGDGGTRVVSLAEGIVSVSAPAHPDESIVRGLIHLPGGEVARLAYSSGVLVHDAAGHPLRVLAMHPDARAEARYGDVLGAARDTDGSGVWWVADTGLWWGAGAEEPELRSADTGYSAIVALPDGGVVTARDDALERRDATGAVGWRLEHEREILSLEVHPDAPLLAVGDLDGWILFLDAVTGEELLRWQGHAERVAALRLSPDGQWLASASWDGALMVHPMAPLLGWLAAGRDDAWLAARLRERTRPRR